MKTQLVGSLVALMVGVFAIGCAETEVEANEGSEDALRAGDTAGFTVKGDAAWKIEAPRAGVDYQVGRPIPKGLAHRNMLVLRSVTGAYERRIVVSRSATIEDLKPSDNVAQPLPNTVVFVSNGARTPVRFEKATASEMQRFNTPIVWRINPSATATPSDDLRVPVSDIREIELALEGVDYPWCEGSPPLGIHNCTDSDRLVIIHQDGMRQRL